MDGQERPKPMACSMLQTRGTSDPLQQIGISTYIIVQSIPPECFPRKHIKLDARSALGEDCTIDGDLIIAVSVACSERSL